jgi:hypothetical protein
MKIYAKANNEVVDVVIEGNPARPDTTHFVEVDEISNPSLYGDVSNNMSQFAIVGGVLQKNSVPVTIAADSVQRTDWKRLSNLLTMLNNKASAQDATDVTGLSAFLDQLAPAAANLTGAEAKRMFRVQWLVIRALLALVQQLKARLD